MSKKEIRKVSFFNWFLTLIFSAIPAVNILFFIITIGCARNPSKRTYAVAALVLTLIVLIALCVGVFCFGDTIAKWANDVIATSKEAAV